MRETAHDPEERRLGGVLGFLPVAELVEAVTEDAVVVPLVQIAGSLLRRPLAPSQARPFDYRIRAHETCLNVGDDLLLGNPCGAIDSSSSPTTFGSISRNSAAVTAVCTTMMLRRGRAQ